MQRHRQRIVRALAVLLISAPLSLSASPRTDYMLNCMGCHLADGRGTPPGIPALKDRVGYYLQVPGGREYLMQVPGAANAPLDNAALAEVLNWVIETFAGGSAPAAWQPFKTSEIELARGGTNNHDIDARRRALWRAIDARFPGNAPY